MESEKDRVMKMKEWRKRQRRTYTESVCAPEYPVIVAMKGPPCTGKSTVAQLIGDYLAWFVIDQDDIRSCLQTATSVNATPEELDHMSFEAVCQIALTQLQMGIHVILDSSLSNRSNLDKLLNLSACTGAVVVILECKPKFQHLWRQWLEQRSANCDNKNHKHTYKPSTWEEFEMMLEKNDQLFNYDDRDVPKLTVNTSSPYVSWQVFFPLLELAKSRSARHLHVDQWTNDMFNDLSKNTRQEPEPRHSPANHIIRFSDERRTGSEMVKCSKCRETVSDMAYNCTHCELYLHQSCAESPQSLEHLPLDRPPFLHPTKLEYSFPQTHSCDACLTEGKGFSGDCEGCMFQTHLDCGLFPTAVRHQGHPHPLVFFIKLIKHPGDFTCKVCGFVGRHFGYKCANCQFSCHACCVLAPLAVKHKHHTHNLMKLTFPDEDGSEAGEEELYCDACETERDRRLWYYECTECYYTSHLTCIRPHHLASDPQETRPI